MAKIDEPSTHHQECGGPQADAFLGNTEYIESLYEQWKRLPDLLPETWRYFFEGFELASCSRPCVASDQARAQASVGHLIAAYRTLGHLLARVDPLGSPPVGHPELDLEAFGLTEDHMDQVFDTGQLHGPPRAPLRDILMALQDIYCRSVGVEYKHIQDPSIRRWLEQEMEPIRNRPPLDRDKKLAILARLVDAEVFEAFLQSHYPGQKRFSLEGAETLIPAVHALVELAANLGVEMVVVGMPHRGRLNMLANILDKSYTTIFAEFEDIANQDRPGGDGDVKYHKGYTSRHDDKITVSLTSNPSHLEAVNPVVEGRARANQWRLDDREERRRVVPLLIHGDAAFAGQGLVAETLNLSQLAGYHVGGTVHFIVNNQIGFTASPEEARSSRYTTDVLKMIEAPIFHVNGDDPEAVAHVTELALRFRQEFGRDVAVDMICYRRHGHSEIDDPAFTQPLMYQKIKSHSSPRTLYVNQLIEAGELDSADVQRLEDEFKARLDAAYKASRASELDCTEGDCVENVSEYDEQSYDGSPVETSLTQDRLEALATAITNVPERFAIARKLTRRLVQQLEVVTSNGDVDWALAEALSLGSLLVEGTPVRLSGQDSMRGTFSHRHAVWYDVNTNEPYTPLNNISSDQAHFCVYNSSITEAAVLGFEYGYSLDAPEMLIIWEAQFGDFANGAQVIIDQFIVSSQAKWQRTSGLVMLLPHGYEGQGPEHSNGYVERYLMACAEDNIQVCNLTTPAQYFHVLRRQMKRDFRRPLIIMSPKSLLRHPRAVSNVNELVTGRFQTVIDDPSPPKSVDRLVLCTGKVFYDLLASREEMKESTVAITRIEQLYPFPAVALLEVADRYTSAKEIVWTQEEPENRGAYRVLKPWLEQVFSGRTIDYAGRPASASPATGSLRVHRLEQKALVERAFGQ